MAGGIERIELYLGLPYIFIGLSILPVILLDHRTEARWYWLSLCLHFAFILLFDRIIHWTAENSIEDRIILDHYLFYKVPQLLLAVGVYVGLMIFLQHSRRANRALLEANRSLVESNSEMLAINDKVQVQNMELNAQQDRISEQYQKLQNYYNELLATKKELLRKIEELHRANTLITEKEAENSSMLDVLRQLFLVIEMDSEGKVNWVNEDFIRESLDWGGAVVGEKIYSVLSHGPDGVEREDLLERLHKNWPDLLTGKLFSFDTNLKSSAGHLLRYHFVLAPILEERGKAVRVLAVGQDITDLVEQRAKIERINKALSDKVEEIEQKNILLNFQQNEIFEKNETLQKQKEEIEAINDSLEDRVRERTMVLEEKNRQLSEYAYINSHILRAPLSSMMGLIGLMKYQELSGDDRRLFELLKETARHLDDIVNKINDAVESGSHFDRSYLEKKTSISDRKTHE
jgi:PAS domain-containing protein